MDKAESAIQQTGRYFYLLSAAALDGNARVTSALPSRVTSSTPHLGLAVYPQFLEQYARAKEEPFQERFRTVAQPFGAPSKARAASTALAPCTRLLATPRDRSRHLTVWEIAENLHRAELTALEHHQHLAEWIRLTEQIEAEKSAPPVMELTRELDPEPEKKRGRPRKSENTKPAQSGQVSGKGGRGKKSGISQASRELGVSRQDAQRALKVAENLTEEAKEAARKHVTAADRRSPPVTHQRHASGGKSNG